MELFQFQNWPSKDSGKNEEKINNILYQEQKYLGEG